MTRDDHEDDEPVDADRDEARDIAAMTAAHFLDAISSPGLSVRKLRLRIAAAALAFRHPSLDGKSLREVARSLGVTHRALSLWRRRFLCMSTRRKYPARAKGK